MKKEKLPEGKEIEIKIKLSEAEKCLEDLPEKLRSKLEKALENVNFWNFLRNCEYLEAVQADFHYTGLMNPPAWSLYCKHLENKGGRSTYMEIEPKDKDKIISICDRKNCPIYKNG